MKSVKAYLAGSDQDFRCEVKWQLLIVVKWLRCTDCTDMLSWIKGMLSMPLLHPYFDLFYTVQPFILTCAFHLHHMSIDKQSLIQYVIFLFDFCLVNE